MIEIEIEDLDWTRTQPDAEGLTRAAAEAALARSEIMGDHGDLVVLLTDDDTVHALNRQFRGRNQPTNVLSFPAVSTAGAHLGDIALAYGVCAGEAQAQGKPLSAHLQHLVVHGVLHLLGYDHEEAAEAEAMEAIERQIMSVLGVPDPYAVGDGEAAGHG